MKFYPENHDVEIEILFTGDDGQPIVPTDITASLYDGDDELVQDLGVIVFDAGATSVTVTVTADLNVLGAKAADARVLRVKITAGTTVVTRTFSYAIETHVRLELANNTFMTLELAEILARNHVRMTGWSQATDERKLTALINAYSRISRVQLRYTKHRPEETVATASRPYDPLRNGRDDCDVVIRPGDWGTRFTKVDFLVMPEDFKTALRLAQLVEANELLTDNPYEARHRAGIISETVGESSVMLRGGKLELGVSSETLRALKGYIYYRVELRRA